MKKKVLLVIGIIVFVVLAAGSVGGTSSKDNVDVKPASTDSAPAKTDKAEKETGEAEPKAAEPKATEPQKKEYEISGVRMEKNSIATYIHGVLTNNGKEKGYVQVTIPCYDKDGAKLGDALANVNNIEAGGKWKFKAMFMGIEKPAKCDVEKINVTGF